MLPRGGGPFLQLLRAFLLVFGLSLEPLGAEESAPGIRSQQSTGAAPPGAGIQSGQPGVTGHPALVIPGAQPSQALSMPQVWRPTVEQPLPPAPPALTAPVVPASFVGCWKGSPDGYDSYTWLSHSPNFYRVGSPGETVFCYRNNTIEIPHAKVYISPARRGLDIALNLGLSYTTFDAHSIHTDIYSITPTRIYARTQLTLAAEGHVFFLFPVHVADEPVIEDAVGTLVAPDTILVESREVLYIESEPVHSATWHANFKRITDEPSQ